MKIIEDITYSLSDVFDKIESDLGFVYTEVSEEEGFITLGKGVKLSLTFKNEQLQTAVLKGLPSQIILISRAQEEDLSLLDFYSSCYESSSQVIDLITRMLGGESEDDESDL